MGQADKVKFYNIAETSLEEVKYYFILSKDRGYIADNEQLMTKAESVSRLLYRLIQSVKGGR